MRFYRLLGLDVADPSPDHLDTFLPNGVRFMFDTEEVVGSFDPEWKRATGNQISLAFECDSPAEVDEAYARVVAAGFTARREPWDAFWGQRYAQLARPGRRAGRSLRAALIEERIELAGREISLLRPPSADELIDEAAFDEDEFLPVLGGAVAERDRARARRRRARPGRACACSSSARARAAVARRGARAAPTCSRPTGPTTPSSCFARNAERNGIALRAERVRWDEPDAAARARRRGRSSSAPICSTRRATPTCCSSCCRGSAARCCSPIRGVRSRRASSSGRRERWEIDDRDGRDGRAAPAAVTVSRAAARRPPRRARAERVTRAPPKPHIVWKPIPFGAQRLAETAAYAKRHYGIDSYVLHPRAIVEHVTVTTTFSSAWNTLRRTTSPTRSCTSFPARARTSSSTATGRSTSSSGSNVICRHTVGLNWAAIGIEHVGLSDAQVLARPGADARSLALTLWLMSRYQIPLADVIGHNESLTSPLHKELYAPWRCQTHGDWRHADMDVYRAKLVALARRYGLALGPTFRPRPTSCG